MEHNNKKVWVVLARSEATSSIPEKSGVVRVQDYIQSAALTSDGKSGTKCKYGRLLVSARNEFQYLALSHLSIVHYLVYRSSLSPCGFVCLFVSVPQLKS